MRVDAARTALTVASVALVGLVSACGSGAASEPDPTSTGSSKGCTDGAVRFLQGQPTDLPGGGSGGIGQVYDDTDPPTVDLAIGADGSTDVPRKLAVDDEFTVLGTTYRIVCISASTVTADPVRGSTSSVSPGPS